MSLYRDQFVLYYLVIMFFGLGNKGWAYIFGGCFGCKV